MKKVLVAIDIARERGNDEVLESARKITTAMDGSLVMLYVLEPTPGYIATQIPQDVLEQRKSQAEQAVRDLAVRHNVPDAVIREGAPATEILEYAGEIKADLIVLYSHDPDMTDYFIGSVASRVVRHAHCSVHVLRHHKE